MLVAVANNMDDAGRLEHAISLPVVDSHEEIGWKQRTHSTDALPVFPNADRLVGRQKGFDFAHGEMPDDRLLILREREDGVPSSVGGSKDGHGNWSGIGTHSMM